MVNIEFKFRSEKTFQTISFPKFPVSIEDVKQAIFTKSNLNSSEFDLNLINEKTNKPLKTNQVERPMKLIVSRKPKATEELPDSLKPAEIGRASASTSPQRQLPVATQSISHRAEDDALASVLSQNKLDNLIADAPAAAKGKGKGDKGKGKGKGGGRGLGMGNAWGAVQLPSAATEGPPPPSYICHRCGLPGHWIKDCPTNDDPEFQRKLRPATGIPMSRLRRVTKAEVEAAGGLAMILPNGDYVMMKELDEDERQKKVGKTIEDRLNDTFGEGGKDLDQALICPICTKLFTNPMATPCCASTYCEACIIGHIESHGKCYNCEESLMAHNLIPNQAVRMQVDELTKDRANSTTNAAAVSGVAKSFEGLLTDELVNKVNAGLGGGSSQASSPRADMKSASSRQPSLGRNSSAPASPFSANPTGPYKLFIKGSPVLSQEDWQKWQATFARKHARHLKRQKKMENGSKNGDHKKRKRRGSDAASNDDRDRSRKRSRRERHHR